MSSRPIRASAISGEELETVTASWPTLFVCSCTGPPTTSSTYSDFSCRSPGAQPRSKPSAPNSSKSRPRPPNRPLYPLPPANRLALSEPVPLRCPRRQQQLTRFFAFELAFRPQFVRSRAHNPSPLRRDTELSLTIRMTRPTRPVHPPLHATPREQISALVN